MPHVRIISCDYCTLHGTSRWGSSEVAFFHYVCVRMCVHLWSVSRGKDNVWHPLTKTNTIFGFSPVLYRQIKINNVSQGTTGPISSFISQFKSDCRSHHFPLICFVWILTVRHEAAKLSFLLTDFNSHAPQFSSHHNAQLALWSKTWATSGLQGEIIDRVDVITSVCVGERRTAFIWRHRGEKTHRYIQ